MDVIKQIQQREKRPKAKAERAKYENTPECVQEEKKKLDALMNLSQEFLS
jgi:hypothetical protein